MSLVLIKTETKIVSMIQTENHSFDRYSPSVPTILLTVTAAHFTGRHSAVSRAAYP